MYLLRPYLNENSTFCIWLATQEKVRDKETSSHVACPALIQGVAEPGE